MEVSPQCSLCQNGVESHTHLFFECCFSSAIWRQILARNGLDRPFLLFSQELEWAVQNRGDKSLRDTIYKLSLAASIYVLWRERNLRIFQNKSRDVNGVTSEIFNSVRAKASSWSTIKFSAHNRQICDTWLLDSSIFALSNSVHFA
ncbi:hypothetical protein RHMOL_Rhmol10G0201900 [Rhododendron molle]|uniref:Uncharacterized protein n=1 Tax=Rhododendron molle TaxID=49168 RepID=A0ACC0M457_RHOML|nr:hypothetical protein RHMOL_Rhmol10G0201900 [Rhododendron molle]